MLCELYRHSISIYQPLPPLPAGKPQSRTLERVPEQPKSSPDRKLGFAEIPLQTRLAELE